MPIKIIISVILISSSCFTYAQKHFGVNGAFQYTTTQSKYIHNYYRNSFNAGLWLEVRSDHKIFGLTYLNYSLKGNANAFGNVNLNYLTNGYFAGMQVFKKAAVLLGAEGSYLLWAIGINGGNRFNFINECRRWDVGIAAGFFYKLSSHLKLTYQYTYGLIGIAKPMIYNGSGYSTVDNKNDPKNKVHSIGLSYRLK